MSTAIDDMLALSSKPRELEADQVEPLLAQIDETIEKIVEQKNALLPVEHSFALALDAQIAHLRGERFGVENTIRTGGLACLDLAPLSWMTDEGFPTFAVFSPDSPIFKLAFSYDSWGSRHTYSASWGARSTKNAQCPPFVKKAYKPALDELGKEGKASRRNVSLTTTFTGMIPPSARESIAKARDVGQVIIVAEAGTWTKQSTRPPAPVYRDPLVCAWDGTSLWLLDRFDVTPIEDYISKEYTV